MATAAVKSEMNMLVRVAMEKPSMSLELPEGMPFDQWVAAGRRLCASSQVINWHIGDWWAFGDHSYGERAKVAAEGIFGREFQTLRNVGAISRSFETSRRRDALTWSHHAEVAVLPPDVADELLEKAEREGLSTRQLRKAVIALRIEEVEARRRPRDVIDIRPASPESDDVDGMSLVEMVVELAEALGRERGLTERESMFLERGLRQLTRHNPRATAAWTAAEEVALVRMLREGQRPKEIAPQLDRTVGAMWRQINRMGGITRILAADQPEGAVGRLGLGNA